MAGHTAQSPPVHVSAVLYCSSDTERVEGRRNQPIILQEIFKRYKSREPSHKLCKKFCLHFPCHIVVKNLERAT